MCVQCVRTFSRLEVLFMVRFSKDNVQWPVMGKVKVPKENGVVLTLFFFYLLLFHHHDYT